MVGKYPIVYCGSIIGNAAVSREGLYYCIRCTCDLKPGRIYRVLLSTGNLGILVPDNGRFTLNVRRPAKQFASITPSFCVIDGEVDWQPVYTDKPFLYLSKLDSAIYQSADGIAGILFRDPAADPQDSGQNP